MKNGVESKDTGEMLNIMHQGALQIHEKTRANYDVAFNNMALAVIPLSSRGAGAVKMMSDFLPDAS